MMPELYGLGLICGFILNYQPAALVRFAELVGHVVVLLWTLEISLVRKCSCLLVESVNCVIVLGSFNFFGYSVYNLS